MNSKEVEKYTEEDYNDMLDEMGNISIGNLSYLPSKVLSEVDPIAYRCGFSDFQEYEYECSECEARFDSEEEAENCCREDED